MTRRHEGIPFMLFFVVSPQRRDFTMNVFRLKPDICQGIFLELKQEAIDREPAQHSAEAGDC
jgi:hypothetical protein